MLKKGDKLWFREDIYLTNSLGKPLVFPTPTTKTVKGVICKVNEDIIIKLANPGMQCTFVEHRPKGKMRVSFTCLAGTHIEGDVEVDKVKTIELVGSVK